MAVGPEELETCGLTADKRGDAGEWRRVSALWSEGSCRESTVWNARTGSLMALRLREEVSVACWSC